MTDLAPPSPHAHVLSPDAQRFADAMPHLVWIARPDGTVEYYNARVQAYAGAQEAPDGTWRWEPLIHPDDAAATALAWESASAANRPYEFEHRIQMQDGQYRWHLSRALPVYDPERDALCWYGTATDVHELRDAREALGRTQTGLGLAMRGGRMGWWSRDMATNEVTWSAELEEIVGLPTGGFGGSEAAFYELVHPDDVPAVASAVEGALTNRTDYVVEFRYRHGDGSWRWMEGRGRAVYDGDMATWLFGLGIDITARRKAADARDAFLGMLSHELRTPVTSIYGVAQLLRRDTLDEPTRRELTEDVIAESERLERLVENLLVLARVERHADLRGHDPIMLRQLTARVVDAELRDRRSSGTQSSIAIHAEPGVGLAVGDEPSVELCLRNLVSNALKYGGGGPIDIRISQTPETVDITVADRGAGLDPAELDDVFELFYRSDAAKSIASGAGVGLYVVRALAEGMGGRTWAKNRDGGGAEIGLSLPRFTETAHY